MNTRATGQIGELAAEIFLKRKGYQIIKRNYRTRYGEIDLICSDKEITVFVEVKLKTTTSFGSPEEMFTPKKCARIRRTATIYLQGKSVKCRVDMVAIVMGGDKRIMQIRHYENVTG